MRLIDADEIPWCEYDLEYYHPFTGVDKEYVDDMPTVDAEPIKYGEWIDGAFENSKRCSVCGKYATKIHNYNEPIFDYVLCPYCGAKMME